MRDKIQSPEIPGDCHFLPLETGTDALPNIWVYPIGVEVLGRDAISFGVMHRLAGISETNIGLLMTNTVNSITIIADAIIIPFVIYATYVIGIARSASIG